MRKGTTLAIVLLLAAILLAGVLKLVFHVGDPAGTGGLRSGALLAPVLRA